MQFPTHEKVMNFFIWKKENACMHAYIYTYRFNVNINRCPCKSFSFASTGEILTSFLKEILSTSLIPNIHPSLGDIQE